MGKITGYNQNNFKSAEPLYAKIRRELKSFAGADLIDSMEFPKYTSDVLRQLGNSALSEDDAMCSIVNGRGTLPLNFKQLYAAYTCNINNCTTLKNKNFQYKEVIENDVTCDLLKRTDNCIFDCCGDKLIERVTIKHYVNDNIVSTDFNNFQLMQLSPNVKDLCSDSCLNINCSTANELTINNGQLFTNFTDGNIYMQYYSMAVDKDGFPTIPDIVEVETAIEWYIKWKIMLNFWFNDDIQNAQNKWQKAEQLYKEAFAEAKFVGKLPSFSYLTQQIRSSRGINKVAAFSQPSHRNY